MAFQTTLTGLSTGRLPSGIKQDIFGLHKNRIHGFVKNNSGKYISQRGFPISKPTGAAIRLRIDVDNIVQRCNNVGDSMKILRIMLFNTILETSVELAYIIKNQMRTDTGTMASSWGVFDPIYLKNISTWSKRAREFFHSQPELAERMAKTGAVFNVINDDENTSNFKPEIIQGSAIPWVAKNELSLGNILQVKNFINIEYTRTRRKLMRQLNNKTNEFIKDMDLTNWDINKMPKVKKLRYKQNRSLIKIANELGVRHGRKGVTSGMMKTLMAQSDQVTGFGQFDQLF